jgi:hypothetical protein
VTLDELVAKANAGEKLTSNEKARLRRHYPKLYEGRNPHTGAPVYVLGPKK